jgi:hypothetical protein
VIGESSSVLVGTASVVTTNGRDLNAEELANMALDRIISISQEAPMPLREQALAFKDKLRAILLFYMKRSAHSERIAVSNLLRKEGFTQIADRIVDIE